MNSVLMSTLGGCSYFVRPWVHKSHNFKNQFEAGPNIKISVLVCCAFFTSPHALRTLQRYFEITRSFIFHGLIVKTSFDFFRSRIKDGI
jgi:hypothetical protein